MSIRYLTSFLLSLLCDVYSPALGVDSLSSLSLSVPAKEPAAEMRVHDDYKAGIDSLLRDPLFERSQVGIYVYDLTADSLVYSHHARQTLRPASTQKIITAVTALQLLGPSYELQTRLYADSKGRIYVRGGYDPLLDSDDLKAFVAALRAEGITALSSPVILDNSFKDVNPRGWGWCWDDKTVPLSPLLYRNRDQFASAFRKALQNGGIKGQITFEEGMVPAKSRLLSRRTHGISEVLGPMMKESDNSMAESLFYQIAAEGSQRPEAGRRDAAKEVERLIREMELDPKDYQIADGSGLSLYNYATPELLASFLRYAYRHKNVYRALLESLPIAGKDGTLERRMRHTPAWGNVCAKTGSVEGVSTLAGYCTTSDGHRLCFSIMNQGLRQLSDGRDFQDRVCIRLCR